MKLIHLKAAQINGSLVTVDGVKEASFDEVATLLLRTAKNAPDALSKSKATA